MEKYRINEFASRKGKSVQAVRRWEREGKFVAKRHVSGHRYFDESDVRLMRFEFDLLNHISTKNGCEIMVFNQESLSVQQKIVQDLMAIVHTFSCRLNGIRKYKNQIPDDFTEYKIAPVKEVLQ
jgi:predicted site-specific integrase-resolvase